MKTIDKLITECELRLAMDKPAYQTTVECDWLLSRLKMAKNETAPKWISVKEKDLSHLKDGDTVLTADSVGNVIAYTFFLGGLNMIGKHSDNNRKITHWMEIPSVPAK